MRIAILTHGVSPFGRRYAAVFEEFGHEARVFSLSAYEGAEAQGVHVVGPRDFKPWASAGRLKPYLKTLRPLRRTMRAYAPDILFAIFLTSAGTLACLSGHPHVVVSARGSDVYEKAGSRPWRTVFRWQARRADLVVAVSEPLKALLVDPVGVDPDRILVCPAGIDTRVLPPIDPADRPDDGRILCTRAHKPVYDQATIVRAAARLRERGVPFRLAFVEGVGVEDTRALVAERNLDDVTTFLPPYEFEELPRLMGEADVYLSASLSDGTSNSLLEAMATATFPVVSDIPANRPWVTHGETGLLFPTGDDEALAGCLERALSDAALRASAAPRLRRTVEEQGDLRRNARRVLEAFERCLQA